KTDDERKDGALRGEAKSALCNQGTNRAPQAYHAANEGINKNQQDELFEVSSKTEHNGAMRIAVRVHSLITPLTGAENGFHRCRFGWYLASQLLDETGAVQFEDRIPALLEGERRHGL